MKLLKENKENQLDKPPSVVALQPLLVSFFFLPKVNKVNLCHYFKLSGVRHHAICNLTVRQAKYKKCLLKKNLL